MPSLHQTVLELVGFPSLWDASRSSCPTSLTGPGHKGALLPESGAEDSSLLPVLSTWCLGAHAGTWSCAVLCRYLIEDTLLCCCQTNPESPYGQAGFSHLLCKPRLVHTCSFI